MTKLLVSGRARLLVLVLHLVALLAGVAFAWSQVADVADQRAGVDAARSVVDQLDSRLASAVTRPVGASAPPTADPFLQGASATVASAALQARVVAAIRTAGGTVTSSQIDMSGAASSPPMIVLSVNCQLADAKLQGLLYTLEAGTPALFVDQLTIEDADRTGPQASDNALKVAMTVSAYWKG